MSTDLDLQNLSVLVTGGTKGLGYEISRAFLRAGANVAVCARDEPKTPISDGDNCALFIKGDVRESGTAKRTVLRTVRSHGRLDVLVNNAGGTPPSDAATASEGFSRAITQLNLLAPLEFSKVAYSQMRDNDTAGVIINIASVSGQRPSPGSAIYGAAKAGLISLTRSLAMEWAPAVRVNAIAIGLAKTELALVHYGSEENIDRIERNIPLGRMATGADVASACRYLASPLAAYVTGAVLNLDGGGEYPPFFKMEENVD